VPLPTVKEIYINKVRTVEAWFDEYKEYYYVARLSPSHVPETHHTTLAVY
jgi:hypothetical protein